MARRRGPIATNRAAAEAMVAAMRALGRLEDVDEPLVSAVLQLAGAVDEDPTHASLWAQYRAAVADLRAVGADGATDDFGQLLKRLDSMSS